jgi:hypothetical protein
MDAGELFVFLITFGYGLFYVFWPEKARNQYLAHFDLDAETKWYKPNTYVKFKPPAGVFRIIWSGFYRPQHFSPLSLEKVTIGESFLIQLDYPKKPGPRPMWHHRYPIALKWIRHYHPHQCESEHSVNSRRFLFLY